MVEENRKVKYVILAVLFLLVVFTAVYAIVVALFPNLKYHKTSISNVHVWSAQLNEEENLVVRFDNKYTGEINVNNLQIMVNDVQTQYEVMSKYEMRCILQLKKKLQYGDIISIYATKEIYGTYSLEVE